MKLNSKSILATLGALVLIGGVATYNKMQTQSYIDQQKQMGSAAKPGKQGKGTGESKLVTVSVVNVIPQNYPLMISGYGDVDAHYSLSLTANVSGKVTDISPYLESGRQVKKGDVLAQLEDSSYQMALASAKSNLATAETSLLEERRQGSQAKKEWERSGLTGEPSALVLRKPQLKAAIASVEYQKAAVKSAQYDLDQTKIRAPFDAIIKSREIELGTSIQSTTTIAKMESSDYVEARILLSENKWKGLPNYSNAQLAHSPNTWSATLSNKDGSWNGYVTRTEKHIETDSRQRALIIQVKQPYAYETPIYPGSFVGVKIVGKVLNSVWKLPISALFQGQDVWYINQKSQLKKQSVNILFSQGDYFYVEPFSDSEIQIVLKPLNYFTENTQVVVKLDEAANNE